MGAKKERKEDGSKKIKRWLGDKGKLSVAW
jgi:hypothetical protein